MTWLLRTALSGLLAFTIVVVSAAAQPAPLQARLASCPPAVKRSVANHTAKDRETSSSRIDVELQALIEDVLGDESDHYGVVVKDTRTNTTASVNPDAIFYAASLFKLPIMVEAFRQRELGLISFDDAIFATWDDVLEDLGTFPGDVGDVYTVADLLELMITISDNTSAIMLLRTLGPGTIDETMSSLGLTTTSVLTEELPTTAVDMATLLEAIERGQAVGAGASREMVDLMLRQTWRSRIPQGVPEGVLVGNKTGDWWDAAHDVAIVYAPGGAYVIAILSDGEGSDATIVELSERVYDYFQACRGRNAPVRI